MLPGLERPPETGGRPTTALPGQGSSQGWRALTLDCRDQVEEGQCSQVKGQRSSPECRAPAVTGHWRPSPRLRRAGKTARQPTDPELVERCSPTKTPSPGTGQADRLAEPLLFPQSDGSLVPTRAGSLLRGKAKASVGNTGCCCGNLGPPGQPRSDQLGFPS